VRKVEFETETAATLQALWFVEMPLSSGAISE